MGLSLGRERLPPARGEPRSPSPTHPSPQTSRSQQRATRGGSPRGGASTLTDNHFREQHACLQREASTMPTPLELSLSIEKRHGTACPPPYRNLNHSVSP